MKPGPGDLLPTGDLGTGGSAIDPIDIPALKQGFYGTSAFVGSTELVTSARYRGDRLGVG
jgi:hypothetical protein